MPNQLQYETSPYLLQHADNPVEWYPWGDEALRRAHDEQKPILLSIGYAACHWCHVMAHESFEDEATAALMNEHFINIKVDREERPDIDQIYMSAVIAMRGQGGWPLTAVLTPEGQPFFGGTYYPKEPRYGMPSFSQVLTSVAEAWSKQREQIYDSARELTDHITGGLVLQGQAGAITKEVLNKALAAMGGRFDGRWGGFGPAPKFPQPMTLEFLLRGALATDDEKLMAMFNMTLEMMARGGMYDQIGGGFARYSTDAKWLVPHFEKMLYDNAQLARIYLHGWQATADPLYKRIAIETCDYILKEMRDPSGGFYSSQDADSEGEEGKFYVWTLDELRQLLGQEAELVSLYYDITLHGNWEGKGIPNMPRRHNEVAAMLRVDEADLAQRIGVAKQTLYEARAQRIWPGKDDKVLTAWNGLMLATLAEAGRVLGRPDYTQAAVANAEFLYANLRTADGRLYRTWKAGSSAKYNGYLEDYAFLAEGLIALYQTTFEERWFVWAQELADQMLAHFSDEAGGFYDTADDHEQLIYRPKDVQDNATPSGNSVAATVLLQLGLYTGEGRYAQAAEQAIAAMVEVMGQYPTGFGQWLNGATLLLNEMREVAIVGEATAADTQALLAEVWEGYRPYQVVAVGDGAGSAVPLLANRPQLEVGKATAYVCKNFACQRPTMEAAILREQLHSS